MYQNKRQRIRKRYSWLVEWPSFRAVSTSTTRREQGGLLPREQLTLLLPTHCLLHCDSVYLTLRRQAKYWKLSDSFQRCQDTSKAHSVLWKHEHRIRFYCWPLPTALSRGPPVPTRTEAGPGVLACIISELKYRRIALTAPQPFDRSLD